MSRSFDSVRASGALKLALLSGLSTIALGGGVAVAQDDAASDSDVIIVTGSRIRQNPLDRSQPVLDVDAEDYNRSGLYSIGDFLQRLPGSGGGLNSRVNSSGNFGNPPDGGGVGAGASEIDMRFLGSRRVLVLVDGLRWVNGSSASGVPGATDLNTIPSSAIDRIEVLQDGASPIYGSDAIAGVINIITKRQQEGFGASAQLGAYGDKDGETQQYEVSFGASNDRTEIFFAVQYSHQNPVSSNDRDISNFPVPTLNECFATCSSATPDGRFIFFNPGTSDFESLTLADSFQWSGTNPVFDTSNPASGDFKNFSTPDRFNFMPFNFVVTPSERVGFFTSVTHQVTETINFRAKAMFNNRKSINQAAPIPLFIGPEAGNGNRMDTIAIDVTNPFNPFGFTLDPSNTAFVARRFIEAGPRRFEQNVDTYYLSGAFDGEFALGERTIYWDANALWSRNRADQLGHGIVNSARLEQALGPIAACTGACVPFNFFGGPGSITQEMVDFVTFVQHDVSEQELWDVSLNFSGELFDLPAGPLGFAAGFEHRDQSGFFEPDPIVAAGDSADIPAQPTSGSYDIDEFYGELSVPILADRTFFEALTGSFAVRYSDYSTGFSETTLKYGGVWKPTEDLTIRGGFTEGFRAPTIGELFGTASRFDATLNDPCSDILSKSATIQANCIALGVPSDGSYMQTNFQIGTVTGGNPALEPETSDGWNVGFTYQPAWADAYNFVAEMNYYDIEIQGAIQALSAQLQLSSCVNTLDAALCSAIGRAPSGTIISFSNQLTNIGGIETRGIDWRVAFDLNDTGFGDFHLESNSNYLIDFTEISPTSTGFISTSREGTLRGSPTFSWPRFKSTATLDWTLGDLNLRGVGRYISNLTEQCLDPLSSLPVGFGCSAPDPSDDSNSFNHLSSQFYLDLSASYNLGLLDNRSQVTFGINNVTDNDPPNCFSCQLNGFDANAYDPPGRFFYVRFSITP